MVSAICRIRLIIHSFQTLLKTIWLLIFNWRKRLRAIIRAMNHIKSALLLDCSDGFVSTSSLFLDSSSTNQGEKPFLSVFRSFRRR